MKTYFITGVAGFIGSNLAKKILKEENDIQIIGLDNMNDYYDVKLKEYRLNELKQYNNFIFIKGNLANKETVEDIFKEYRPEIVVNLAAQAGVRYSITNPDAYIESNLIGFYNIFIVSPASNLLVNPKYAMSGLPAGPYTVKNLNPVEGILYNFE